MDKILDILTEIEAEVKWSVYDGNDNEKIMGLIHQAMDIAVQGKAHKWPEEKPKEDKEYLVLHKFTFFNKTFDKMIYHSGEWEVVDGGMHFDVDDEDILYWWGLPEVEES